LSKTQGVRVASYERRIDNPFYRCLQAGGDQHIFYFAEEIKGNKGREELRRICSFGHLISAISEPPSDSEKCSERNNKIQPKDSSMTYISFGFGDLALAKKRRTLVSRHDVSHPFRELAHSQVSCCQSDIKV
jgi:hypothetical protein